MSPEPLDVEAAGLPLRVWDHGGAGPAVLFLHGYLDTGRSYDAVAAALEGRARALCLDWRGHGQSAWVGAGGSYHLLDHLKDLAVVTERLEARGVALEAIVAHSMGGNVALLFAGARPERVRRLLLLDSLGAPPEDAEEQPARLEQLLRSLGPARPFSTVASEEEAAARVRSQNPGLSLEGAARMVAGVLVPDEGDPSRLRFPFDPRLRGPTPVRWSEAMWKALCARVTATTHVLRAEQGHLPEGGPTADRNAALRRATFETLQGASHHLHVEAPDEVARVLLALLAR